MAQSIPLMTAEGKNAPMVPARAYPRAIWITPARTTLIRNGPNPPRVSIAVKTITVRPAAGPETLSWEPLAHETTRPPMMPAIIPEKSGAPDARAIPRQRGSATKKTPMLAGIS